jgi:type I restriction-modification system DNA methylase subunit
MGMTREEIINNMIDTVNIYNIDLMKQAGLADEEINKNIESQEGALNHMFGLIYQSLANKDAFK